MFNPEFNHTARFINQQIFDKDNFRIGTIDFGIHPNYMSKKKQELLQKNISFNPKIPEMRTSILNERHLEFEPEFIIRKKNVPKIVKKNNLVYVSIVKNGKVISKKISNGINIEKNSVIKCMPHDTELIVDLNNKRVRLKGFKTSPEWVKIDASAIPNN